MPGANGALVYKMTESKSKPEVQPMPAAVIIVPPGERVNSFPFDVSDEHFKRLLK